MTSQNILLRVTYDPQADAAYVYLTDTIEDGGVAYTATGDDPDLQDGVHLDVNHAGEVVGIELLGAALLSPHLRRRLNAVPEQV